MTFASSTTGAMQINVIQFGSFGCARTTTKMIRQIKAHSNVILIKNSSLCKFLEIRKFHKFSIFYVGQHIFHLSLL